MSSNPSFFYALETRWMGPDRFFKIFAQPGLLCGARVAGQFYDRDSAYRQLVAPAQVFAPLMARLADRLVQTREQEERTIDGLPPESVEFLRRNAPNFQLPVNAVRQVTFEKKRSWWTARNHGRMDLLLHSRRRIRFLLVEQPSEQVSAILQSLGIEVRFLP